MVLALKTSLKSIFSVDFARLSLAVFAFIAALAAAIAVFLNDWYFWRASPYYLNPYLFLATFLLGLSWGSRGLAICIFLLPLSAGLGNQLNAYLGSHFLMLPNAGLDLVAGLFVGVLLGVVLQNHRALRFSINQAPNLNNLKRFIPWPIGLMILMETMSTVLAISRNVYQSAAPTSLKGLLFNLVHFRPIGWHDDYMPISDWIAYALAVAMMILVIGKLKNQENKNRIIFRPIMAGLIVAALMGISQAITGLGLPEHLLGFRKDQLGYAVIGLQPDLHAFAGHMLLGAVGLWGYFYSGLSRVERKFILFVVALSWIGLVLSKSRALLLIALTVMLVWLVCYLWRNKRNIFLPTIAIVAMTIGIGIVLIFKYSNHLSGIAVLSWLSELANEFKSRDLTSWSLLSGIFGSRFEIWGAAIRMWWEFPLMGIGQGNFYRLSDIASFSKSHFLILNHGENAHNYFLQSLTETGVIGAAIFVIALLAPLMSTNKKCKYIPGVIGILGLFLGNIFSHSFLVRENLLLASVLVGLVYGQSLTIRLASWSQLCIWKNFPATPIFFILIVGIAYFIAKEISFGKYPFTYGIYCYQKEPMSQDGWTKGIFELPLQRGADGVELRLDVPQLKSEDHPIILRLELRRILRSQLDHVDKIDLLKQKVEIKRKKDNRVVILLSGKDDLNKFDNIELEGMLSSCYSPRNSGDSTDSRILGAHISVINW